MGLDILLLRNPETAELVRESQRRRGVAPESVDEVIKADEQWRRLQFLAERSNRLINDCSRAVGEKKKAKEADGATDPVDEALLAKIAEDESLEKPLAPLAGLSINQYKAASKWFTEKQAQLIKDAEAASVRRDALLGALGNIVHESVPVGTDEDTCNRTERTFGDVTRRLPLNHVDLMEKLGMMDTSRTVTSMAGGRAYVLKGGLVQLQLALLSYGMSFLVARGYTPFYPPFFMTRDAMADVAQLSQFDEELYKVTGEGDDKYLIATSEMPIAAYHRGKWFAELPEPIKYAGMSACFRKEAGAHGRDTTGIFRVHQFDKLEQFLVCSPRDGESWQHLESMITTSEDFCKSLGLPYRVINICSGALNNAAAKKYDLEAWFPGSGAFRELVSCSNCTDFQARAVNCRYGANLRGTTGGAAGATAAAAAAAAASSAAGGAVKEFTHMLNGTLCAITRTMCCICENYQTPEGIVVPEVLRPFMMGKDMLRFETPAAAAPGAPVEKK